MITDKVSVDGSTVTIKADSEATARAIAAAADRDRIVQEGGVGEKIDAFFDDVGDRVEGVMSGLNRPSLGILSLVLAVVCGVMTFMSFGALMPQLEMLFGIVGIVVVCVAKESVTRWAKAVNLNAPSVATTYKNITFGAVALIFVVAVAYQASLSQDVETGTVAINEAVEREDRDIRDAGYEIEKLPHPQDAAEILALDIERRLAQSAQTKAGDPAGFTIGNAVGAGPRGAGGLQPETFCMPNKAMQSYIDRYCEDLIDMEKGLQRRLTYDRAIADLQARKQKNDDARTHLPKKSSSLALADRAGGGVDANLWGVFFVALGMMFVEIGMVATGFYAKRHPRGVTAALAALSQPAAQGAAP